MVGNFLWGAGGVFTVLLQVLDLMGIAVQPSLEIAGEVVDVDGAAVGVAEDSGREVVTAGDDISLVVADVEDIVRLGGLRGGTHGGMAQGGHWDALAAVLHEGQGVLLRLLAGDGTCHGLHRQDKNTYQQQGEYRFYTLRFHHC